MIAQAGVQSWAAAGLNFTACLELSWRYLTFDTSNLIIHLLTAKATKTKKKVKAIYYRVSLDMNKKMYMGLQKSMNKIQ